MQRYGQRITTTRPSSATGQQDKATGRMTNTPVEEVIYAGPCDCQAGDRRRGRDASGEADMRADATVYLPGHAPTVLHRPDDAVAIEWVPSRHFPLGLRRTGRVIAVGEDAGALSVAWLGAATDGVPA